MQQFSGFRTLTQLKKVLKEKRWKLYTKKYKEGSDYVSFDFQSHGKFGTVLLNTVNGTFFGQTMDDLHFNSQDSSHDEEPWIQDLLNTVYLPLEEPTK